LAILLLERAVKYLGIYAEKYEGYGYYCKGKEIIEMETIYKKAPSSGKV